MEITYKFSIYTHTHTRIVELEQTKINNNNITTHILLKETNYYTYSYIFRLIDPDPESMYYILFRMCTIDKTNQYRYDMYHNYTRKLFGI